MTNLRGVALCGCVGPRPPHHLRFGVVNMPPNYLTKPSLMRCWSSHALTGYTADDVGFAADPATDPAVWTGPHGRGAGRSMRSGGR